MPPLGQRYKRPFLHKPVVMFSKLARKLYGIVAFWLFWTWASPNYLKIALLTIVADLNARKHSKKGEDEYSLSKEDNEQPNTIDLRGKIRQQFGFAASLKDPSVSSVCSPISALLPLGKLALGAQGDGLQELSNAIGVSSNEYNEDDYDEIQSDSLKEHLSGLIKDLNNLEGVTLDVASRLYVSEDKRLYKNYSRAAKKIFKTSIEKINFNNPRAAADNVNDWVSRKTHGMIPNIITSDAVSHNPSLLIVNAIYFAGKWEHPFRQVESRDFHSSKGTKKVPMMTNTAWYNYGKIKSLSAQLIRIRYVGGKSSFLIVLPNKRNGLRKLLNRLKDEPQLLADAIGNMRSTNIQLTMPKFKIESQWDLRNLYEKIGMSVIFDRRKSGLTGIVCDENLDVSEAIQKAVIEVTEEGTKAAASSGLLIWKNVAPDLVVDRPFLFFVLVGHQQLISGTLVDPSPTE